MRNKIICTLLFLMISFSVISLSSCSKQNIGKTTEMQVSDTTSTEKSTADISTTGEKTDPQKNFPFKLIDKSRNFAYLDFNKDYKFDSLLKIGVKSNEELVKFTLSEYPDMKIDLSQIGYGCSAFLTESSDNDIIYGRNFDMDAKNTGAYLVVHTAPENGYESYSTVNLGFIGIKSIRTYDEEKISKEIEGGTSPLLFAPYIPLDGVNEKGVAISILLLEFPEIHEEGKNGPALTSTTMIRNVLDNAATLEEAIELFEKCSLHTDGYAYHYLVSDASGKSAVIEYAENKLVVEYKKDKVQTVANTYISEECKKVYTDKNAADSEKRTSAIEKSLEEHGYSVSDPEKAMEILGAGAQDTTRWSVVYNLTKKSISYCLNGNFENIAFQKTFQ